MSVSNNARQQLVRILLSDRSASDKVATRGTARCENGTLQRHIPFRYPRSTWFLSHLSCVEWIVKDKLNFDAKGIH